MAESFMERSVEVYFSTFVWGKFRSNSIGPKMYVKAFSLLNTYLNHPRSQTVPRSLELGTVFDFKALHI